MQLSKQYRRLIRKANADDHVEHVLSDKLVDTTDEPSLPSKFPTKQPFTLADLWPTIVKEFKPQH